MIWTQNQPLDELHSYLSHIVFLQWNSNKGLSNLLTMHIDLIAKNRPINKHVTIGSLDRHAQQF